MLPRKMSKIPTCLLPCLLGMVTVLFLCGDIANAQRSYSDSPPHYSYDNLPTTGFTCQGKLPGRYYPDPETDCQMFHVCVKMNGRDVKGFKFLCPNGTVFDSEHQVCVDYYQVVCHTDVGTNPLGHIFEIYKLSSDQGSRDLDIGKLSFVNPDSIERNTLGDDFQVQEHNTNHLASSQNSLNFRSGSSQSAPKPSHSSARTGKSNKAKEDIFFGNKGFGQTSFDAYKEPSTTRRPATRATSTTTTTTTTTEAPSSSTPRRPSLETFESYETESFSGFIPAANSFRRGQEQSPDFDASTEDLSTRDDDQYRPPPVSTTARPFVFQNTFRTTLSHLPSTSKPNIPAQQTFQQQPTRFNEEYFTRIPSTTRRPVSKAAQFFLHSTTADDYFTPEYKQPTANPFFGRQQTKSTTTIRPNLVFQSNLGTVRPAEFSGSATTNFRYETSTPRPTTTTRYTTTRYTTSTTEAPTTTEYFGRYRQEEDFSRQTTTFRNDFTSSSRNSNFFSVSNPNIKDGKEVFGGKSTTKSNFPPQLSSQYVEEESLRPRNIHGASNGQNSFNIDTSPETIVDTDNTNRPWDTFGFSTVPPPTTAEPFSTPPPTTAAAIAQETAQTLAARLQGQLFKKITTKNPERFSIFFGRGTTPSAPGGNGRNSTVVKRKRVRSTTLSPLELETASPTTEAISARGRLIRIHSQGTPTSTVAPDQASPSQGPRRRGVRRRVKPGRRPEGKTFDPQLKYTRRRFDGDGNPIKNDEIFNAEASVFRGDPALNNFFEDRKKEGKNEDVSEQAQKQPVNHFAQNFGRRQRPGTEANQNNEGRPNNTNNTEGAPVPGPQIRRRVVKRIRPKTSTTQPDTEDKKEFVVTGSTLRPVTRINVKTKLGGKISTTFRTTEITDGFSSTASSTTTITTTEEPELVTASEDEVQEKRHQNHKQAFPDLKKQRPRPSNNSHLVIKVLDNQFSPSPPLSSSPLSIKKPILSSPQKKLALIKSGASQQQQSSGKKIQPKGENEEESQTRSPDYDYAYYNTDDGSDYDSETSKIDHKNYGKKPKSK